MHRPSQRFHSEKLDVIPIDENNEIHVGLIEIEGRRALVDIRVLSMRDTGYTITQNAISLAPEVLPDLIEALARIWNRGRHD